MDLSLLSDAELRRRGVTALPATLTEAVDALERDHFLTEVLGSPWRELYTTIKRADVRDLATLTADEVFALHANRFWKTHPHSGPADGPERRPAGATRRAPR